MKRGQQNTVSCENDTFVPDYYVYTDGSCSSNGSAHAKAGMGIYFGADDPRNVSQRVEGKQSNNTAELGAILLARKIIDADVKAGKKIMIVSDSTYAIRAVTTYGEACATKGWAKDIPNKDMVRAGYELYKDVKNVRFKHVLGHTEGADIHSVGNDGADRLANMAIGLESCPYASVKSSAVATRVEVLPKTDKIYLNVPYARKEEAKKLGARWDAGAKKWYSAEGNAHTMALMELFG